MQIENRKEEVPFTHYHTLFRQADPMEIAKRTGTNWDGRHFHIPLLSRSYRISHPDGEIRALVDGTAPPFPQQIFLLRYLLKGRSAYHIGGWKTFRELPWGETYSAPYTRRVLMRAALTFGRQIDAFRRACEALGGQRIDQGDSGYEFVLIGYFKMRILIWAEDEEFPPSAQILYSDNFAADFFTAEDRVVAAEILISTIKKHM